MVKTLNRRAIHCRCTNNIHQFVHLFIKAPPNLMDNENYEPQEPAKCGNLSSTVSTFASAGVPWMRKGYRMLPGASCFRKGDNDTSPHRRYKVPEMVEIFV